MPTWLTDPTLLLAGVVLVTVQFIAALPWLWAIDEKGFKEAAVRFGVQRAEVEFAAPALGRDPFVLAFENVGGLIEASVAAPGWADELTDAQRTVFVFALRGLLDMGAAARYDFMARTPDAPHEPGFAALARRVTWAEWVARWETAKTVTVEAKKAHH